MRRKGAPYDGMQNGSHGEKEKGRESKAKNTMVETEGDKLSIKKRLDRRWPGFWEARLPDERDKTVEMLKKSAETVLGVPFGKRKGDRETWWWNEEVQESTK